MMTIYIDKDALLHKMQERHGELARDYGDYDNYVMGFGDALELLENAPAETDVHEDVEGKWVHMNNKEVKCSRCSLIRNITTQEGWRFCPSCGALMMEDE